jgi:hypothetical protein
MNHFERGFMVGMIEGEGTITLSCQWQKRKKYVSVTMHPTVNIVNTCKELIEKANPIWHGSIFLRERNSGKRKPCYRTEIHSIEKVKVFLEEVMNDLTCKRRQAELVLEFCNLRIEKRDKKPSKLHGCCRYGEGYGEREFEILKEIRLLNVPKAGYHNPEFYEAIEQRVNAFKEGYKDLNHAKSVERKCGFCGKIFKIVAHKLTYKGQNTGTYCSTKCRGYALRARQVGLTFEQARVKWIDKLRPIGVSYL